MSTVNPSSNLGGKPRNQIKLLIYSVGGRRGSYLRVGMFRVVPVNICPISCVSDISRFIVREHCPSKL